MVVDLNSSSVGILERGIENVDGDNDVDDDIYIMMHVCVSRKMSTSSWESPVTTWTPHTTLSNSRLVLMVPDWFFMVPCRFL